MAGLPALQVKICISLPAGIRTRRSSPGHTAVMNPPETQNHFIESLKKVRQGVNQIGTLRTANAGLGPGKPEGKRLNRPETGRFENTERSVPCN